MHASAVAHTSTRSEMSETSDDDARSRGYARADREARRARDEARRGEDDDDDDDDEDEEGEEDEEDEEYHRRDGYNFVMELLEDEGYERWESEEEYEDEEYEYEEYENDVFDDGARLRRRAPRARFESDVENDGDVSSESEIEEYDDASHLMPYYDRARSVMVATTCNHEQGADALTAAPRFACDERALGPQGSPYSFDYGSLDEAEGKRCTLGMPDFFLFRRHVVAMCVGGVTEGARESAHYDGLLVPYSMDYDHERKLLAVCGMGYDPERSMYWNVAVYEIDSSEEIIGTGTNVNPNALYNEVCRLNVGLPDESMYAQPRPPRANLQMDFTDAVHQANCIRFARLENVMGDDDVDSYLLLSSNDGYVYYIHLSEANEDTRARKAVVVRSDFHQISMNCAEPSPCGMMVAYCGDSRLVGVTFLASPSQGAFFYDLRLKIPSLHAKLPRIVGSTHSCQYVRWSPDGRYLAATSDATHSITVWRMDGVNGRDPDETVVPPMVAHFWDHALPVLPVVFAQHNPSIMVWAEREGRVHTFDVREAEDHYAEVADIVKDVPEEELAQLSTMKDGLEDFGCTVVNMRRRVRPPSFDEIKTWVHINPVERRAIWKTSFLEGDVLKDFTIQTVNNLRGFHDPACGMITGLAVSCVTAPRGTLGENASDVIMWSSGRAVFAYRLTGGMRGDMSNFLSFPRNYIESMQTFLLCVKASRRNGREKTCLADLPMEIIHEIMARAAMPIYKWSGRRSREAARAREGSKIYKWSGRVREKMEPVDEDRGIQNFFNMAMSMGLRREAEEDPVEEELL